MANKFRNELEIKLGSETILLRPTFENLSAMESEVGGIAYLGWKYSRGVGLGKKEVSEEAIKSFPTLTETAKIIYHNQLATDPDDSTKKKFSLEEIWDMVLVEGAACAKHVVLYIAKITAGDKMRDSTEEISDDEKKS